MRRSSSSIESVDSFSTPIPLTVRYVATLYVRAETTDDARLDTGEKMCSLRLMSTRGVVSYGATLTRGDM